jgi:hypothetical protein
MAGRSNPGHLLLRRSVECERFEKMSDNQTTPATVDFTRADALASSAALDAALDALSTQKPQSVIDRMHPPQPESQYSTWAAWLREQSAVYTRQHEHKTALIFQAVANRIVRVASDPLSIEKSMHVAHHEKQCRQYGPAMQEVPTSIQTGLASLARALQMTPHPNRSRSFATCERDLRQLQQRLFPQ